MNYDDDAYTRTATITQQAIDAVLEALQIHCTSHTDSLSVLAIVAHHLMESEGIDTFESVTYDGHGIRLACTDPAQPRPTIH